MSLASSGTEKGTLGSGALLLANKGTGLIPSQTPLQSNDVVVIIYYEGTTAINPATFESQFNHVFALVQPLPNSGA